MAEALTTQEEVVRYLNIFTSPSSIPWRFTPSRHLLLCSMYYGDMPDNTDCGLFIIKGVNANRGPVDLLEVAGVNASRVSELATLNRIMHNILWFIKYLLTDMTVDLWGTDISQTTHACALGWHTT